MSQDKGSKGKKVGRREGGAARGEVFARLSGALFVTVSRN